MKYTHYKYYFFMKRSFAAVGTILRLIVHIQVQLMQKLKAAKDLQCFSYAGC